MPLLSGPLVAVKHCEFDDVPPGDVAEGRTLRSEEQLRSGLLRSAFPAAATFNADIIGVEVEGQSERGDDTISDTSGSMRDDHVDQRGRATDRANATPLSPLLSFAQSTMRTPAPTVLTQ